MSRPDDLVQPILVAKGGSHLNTIKAAALASIGAYVAHRDDPAWNEWLQGRFTKTARRAKPTDLDKLLESDVPAFGISVGDASAAAATPMRYADFPKVLAKAQVSGTDFPREDGHVEPPSAVALFVDEKLTTGKASAQAAHALWMWAMSVGFDAFVGPLGIPLSVDLVDQELLKAMQPDVGQKILRVHDAGLTEIPAGSLTAAVRF